MIIQFPKGRESNTFWECRRLPDVDRLSHADLKDLMLRLLEEVAELQRTVAELRAMSNSSAQGWVRAAEY